MFHLGTVVVPSCLGEKKHGGGASMSLPSGAGPADVVEHARPGSQARMLACAALEARLWGCH